jgi:hypothetical protein
VAQGALSACSQARSLSYRWFPVSFPSASNAPRELLLRPYTLVAGATFNFTAMVADSLGLQANATVAVSGPTRKGTLGESPSCKVSAGVI